MARVLEEMAGEVPAAQAALEPTLQDTNRMVREVSRRAVFRE